MGFRNDLTVALAAAAGLAACGSPTQGGIEPKNKARAELLPESAVVVDFEQGTAGALPPGFRASLTGDGQPGRWELAEVADAPSGRRVLAQRDGDATEQRFPLCVFDTVRARDVHAGVSFRAVGGEDERSVGLMLRYRDKDNYYVVRANALDGNVRLDKVVGGKRKQFAGTSVAVRPDRWHALGVELKGDRFRVYLDGRLLFEASDRTFGEAGRVGVWTHADSLAWFDDLRVAALDG